MGYSCAAITGASSGIGRAIALRLASEGVPVALFARNREKLNNVAEEIRNLNPKARILVFSGDVRSRELLEDFIAKCQQSFGELDIFINNAGIAVKKSFVDMDPEQVQSLIDTNFSGSVWSIYYAMRSFVKNKKGTLVNISSTSVLKPASKAPLYTSTKAGVFGLVRALEEEYLTAKNIKVINILPGPTLTGLDPARAEVVEKENLISPDDIAHWVWMALQSPATCKISNIVLRNTGQF
jgi:3-oxoacyl-[acyl-carrier protein] reductase